MNICKNYKLKYVFNKINIISLIQIIQLCSNNFFFVLIIAIFLLVLLTEKKKNAR